MKSASSKSATVEEVKTAAAQEKVEGAEDETKEAKEEVSKMEAPPSGVLKTLFSLQKKWLKKAPEAAAPAVAPAALGVVLSKEV